MMYEDGTYVHTHMRISIGDINTTQYEIKNKKISQLMQVYLFALQIPFSIAD